VSEALAVGLAREGAISDELGGAIGGLPWGDGLTDHLAERLPITTIPTQGCQPDRNASLGLDAQLEPHVVEVGPMISAIPPRDGHDLLCRRLAAVIGAIAMEAGALRMRHAWGQPSPRSGRGGHETLEGCDVIGIARSQGPAQRIIIAMAGVDQHRCQASRYRLILENPRDHLEWLGHKAEAVQDHGVDGLARGHDPRVWLVSGGSGKDLTNAKCIEHTRDQAQMVEDLTPIGVWHGLLLSRGDSTDP
jgi:hypothetical protein